MLYNIIAFLLIIHSSISKDMFSEDDEDLINDITQHLKIRRCIIITDNETQVNPSIFKRPFAEKIYTGIRNENGFFSRKFSEVKHEHEDKTVIVYKSIRNIATMNDVFLSDMIYHFTSFVTMFTWLMFIQPSEIKDINFTIPYNSDFFIVQYSDFFGFNVTKICNLGENLIFENYEMRDPNFSLSPRFPARMTANGTEFTAYVNQGHCSDEYVEKFVPTVEQPVSDCVKEIFLKDLVRSMNFWYKEEYLSVNSTGPFHFDVIIQFTNIGQSFRQNLGPVWDEYKLLKYWPGTKLKLLMKYPGSKSTPDFYLRPFQKDMWTAIVLIIFLGGLCSASSNYFRSAGTKCRDIIEYFLVPFASLCCQGEYYNRNLSFRTCCLIFRVLAIFIIQSYCSDLVSYLSLEILKLPIRSFEELAESNNYKLLLQTFGDNGMGMDTVYITESNDTVTQKVRDRAIEYYSTVKEREEKMCSNKKFVRFYTENLFGDDLTCKLIPLPVPVTSYINTVLFDAQSPYTDLINHKFLQALESGIIPRIEKYFKTFWKKKSQLNERKNFETVGINQLAKIFSFLGVACITGFILLLIEFSIKKLWKILQKRKQFEVEAKSMHIPRIIDLERDKVEVVTEGLGNPIVKRAKIKIVQSEELKISRREGYDECPPSVEKLKVFEIE